MSRTVLALVVLSLANVSLLVINSLSKKAKHESFEKQMEGNKQIHNLEQNLYLKGLIDENRIVLHKEHASSHPVFVMLFSYMNCDLCKTSAFFEVERMTKKIGVDHLKVFGTFMSDRDFLVYKNVEKRFTFSVNKVPEKTFGLFNEEDASYPFFFVLFPDGTVQHVFIPMKEDVNRTRQYLDIIYQKYFKKASNAGK